MVRVGIERLPDLVGHEHHEPARPQWTNAVSTAAKIRLRGHVADRVVHKYRVEAAVEADRAHVALEVLALGVTGGPHREHLRREVDQREVELCLQVGRVVPAAAAELQDLPTWPITGTQEPDRVRSFLLVVPTARQGPPLGELAVEAVLAGWVHPLIIVHPATA